MLRRFRFLDPADLGELRDGELELVPPTPELAEAAARSDPDRPEHLARAEALAMTAVAPGGREKGSVLGRWGGRWGGRVPAYHFWMRLHPLDAKLPPVPIAGGVGLRVGDSRELRLYSGHVGYHVHRPARGHAYAARSVRLLLPLARAHGMTELWVTANPDNTPSRRTIENLGGEYVGTVRVPRNHPLHRRGEREKARYRIDLTPDPATPRP